MHEITDERPSILIVEDYETTRISLGKLFRRQGWEPTIASTGIEATAYIHSGAVHPDIFIVDLDLPGTPGRAVIKLIRDCKVKSGNTGLPSRVVAYTGQELSGDQRREVLDLGADDIIVKPCDWETLYPIVTGRPLRDPGL